MQDHFRWGHKFNALEFVVGKESMIVSDGDDHARRRASVQIASASRLAQMELTLIVARIAQRLDITSTASQIPRPVGMVVNRPAGGAPMRVSAQRP